MGTSDSRSASTFSPNSILSHQGKYQTKISIKPSGSVGIVKVTTKKCCIMDIGSFKAKEIFLSHVVPIYSVDVYLTMGKGPVTIQQVISSHIFKGKEI